MPKRIEIIRALILASTSFMIGCSSVGGESMKKQSDWLRSFVESDRANPSGALVSSAPTELSEAEIEAASGMTADQMRRLIDDVLTSLKKTPNVVSESEILFVSVRNAQSYSIHYKCRNPLKKPLLEAFLDGAIRYAVENHPSYAPKPYPRACWSGLATFRPEFSGREKSKLELWVKNKLQVAKGDPRLKGHEIITEVKSDTEFTIKFDYMQRYEDRRIWSILDEHFKFYMTDIDREVANSYHY
jgi:hypothetical protein